MCFCMYFSLPLSFSLSFSLCRTNSQAHVAHTHCRSTVSCQFFFSHKIIRNGFASPCRPLPVTLSPYSSRTEVWFESSVPYALFVYAVDISASRFCLTYFWHLFFGELSPHQHTCGSPVSLPDATGKILPKQQNHGFIHLVLLEAHMLFD